VQGRKLFNLCQTDTKYARR